MTTNEREDANAISNLFKEWHYADNLGVLRGKLVEYVATVRQEVWDEVLLIANEHLDQSGFGHVLRDKLRKAAAKSAPKDSEEEGDA